MWGQLWGPGAFGWRPRKSTGSRSLPPGWWFASPTGKADFPSGSPIHQLSHHPETRESLWEARRWPNPDLTRGCPFLFPNPSLPQPVSLRPNNAQVCRWVSSWPVTGVSFVQWPGQMKDVWPLTVPLQALYSLQCPKRRLMDAQQPPCVSLAPCQPHGCFGDDPLLLIVCGLTCSGPCLGKLKCIWKT